MRTLVIKNASGLCGTVYPDYGGMLAKLELNGRPIFWFDEKRVKETPLLSGGNPVLFPFPSQTDQDAYHLNGKRFIMPFHGLVTNSAFAVDGFSDTHVRVFTTNNAASKKDHYPFDFTLQLLYEMQNDGVEMVAFVRNHSLESMPHCFGWHCYFVATDKEKFNLHVDMNQYIDYGDKTTFPKSGPQDLTINKDYVYFDKNGCVTTIVNRPDGYKAEIIADKAFEVLTVCTKFKDCICVEPWLGLPNSINLNRYVQWVAPGEEGVYRIKIKVSDFQNISNNGRDKHHA